MAILRQVKGKGYFNIPDEALEQYLVPEDKQADVLANNGIKLGVAGTPPEGAEVKRLELAWSTAATADATASYLRWNVAVCPHCGTANRILEDTDRYLWFTCAGCGGSFRF